MKQLSDTVGLVGDKSFYARFRDITARYDTYLVLVCEDLAVGRIVGAASLIVEMKFIHNCGKARAQRAAALPQVGGGEGKNRAVGGGRLRPGWAGWSQAA